MMKAHLVERLRSAMRLLAVAVALIGCSTPTFADPNQGPGGPILVVTSGTSEYGTFYAEVLRNEGFNAFSVADIASVNSTMLGNVDVVILAHMPLSAGQVSMFSNWVSAGGNLIAMRPAPELATLLGISFQGSTLTNAYLLIDTTEDSPGNGLVDETIQFFGAADRYTLNGAQEVARLYSSASTGTANPAVTIRGVGSSGGQAVGFAYDLATSLVYARQGNPAWNGQERDGIAPIRPDDLYFGNAAVDPQPDWVNLTKAHIPQADEQQRLLANLIWHVNADKRLLPRFWYLPRGERAVILMTGDDHGNGGTTGRFDQFMAASPPNCSVADWECVRGTSYIYPDTPISDSEAGFYESQGFEVGLHVNTGCSNYSRTSLETIYDQQIAAFSAAFPSVPGLSTQRHHCIAWSDWVSGAEVQLERGIRLDTTYYYWPPSWVQNRPGFFTGSAMPMRFADLDGNLIDVYQAVTHMTDESGQQYPFTVQKLLDWALGPEGYVGVFTANLHTDAPRTAQADAVLGTALSRGVPIVSGEQMLEWLDGRNASSFASITWDGTSASFSVTQAAQANGLRAYVPYRRDTGVVTGITRNGSPVVFSIERLKGIEYAFFNALTGAYTLTYQPDTTPPEVISTTPPSGSSGVSRLTSIAAVFNEALTASSVSSTTVGLRDSANQPLPATVSYDDMARQVTVTAADVLSSNATYSVVIEGGSAGIVDLVGNALASDFTWTFTTGTGPDCPCGVWTEADVPANPAEPESSAIELGVKFTVDYDGLVSGIRFYKSTQNTGTHFGHLWTLDGELLASVQFTNETASGWQEATFSSAVPVAAGVVYVASYHAPNGFFAQDVDYFLSGDDDGLVNLLQNGVSGGNGVFNYGPSGTFPTTSYRASNYWVDVGYTPSIGGIDSVPPVVTATTPADGAVGVNFGAQVTATFSEPIDQSTLSASTFQLIDSSGQAVVGTVDYDSASRTATLSPASPLSPLVTYTARVVGGGAGVRDLVGNPLATHVLWSFTAAPPDAVPPSITQVSPADGSVGVPVTLLVTAAFDEELDSASVNASTFELSTLDGNPVPSDVTYGSPALTASLRPSVVLPFTTYIATVRGGTTGVRDLGGNHLASDFSWSFTTGAVEASSVWDDSVIPPVPSNTDSLPVEVGVKFTVDFDGFITAVRFYKGQGNTGTHVGNLWSASGQLLGTATFANETAQGWQQVQFAEPVAVSPGNVYIASYHAPNGRYALSSNFFANSGVDAGPVNLLQNGVAGGNGVYAYGSVSSFPTNSWEASNYWVDVVFATSGDGDVIAPTVTSVTPGDGSTEVSPVGAVAATFDEELDPASVNDSTFELRLASGTVVAATVAYDSASSEAVLTPGAILEPSSTYIAMLRGRTAGIRDLAGNPLTADLTWSFTTGTSGQYSVWDDTVIPPVPTQNDAAAVELGVKFTVDFEGYITAVRFYKDAANSGPHVGSLWSSSGVLLARATFANETSSGWQQVQFTPPVLVSPGNVYIASYHAPNGRYALSANFFRDGGVDLGPVNLLQDGVAGGNGVFAYGSSSSFPTNAWNASNYWVDVVFGTIPVDDTAPGVTGTTPPDGSSGVSTGAMTTATFDEPLDPLSVDAATFELRASDGSLVAATVTYDANALRANLTPGAGLDPLTTYFATLRGGPSGVRDLAGNPLASDHVWSFTTDAGAPRSVWDDSVTPPMPTQSDGGPVELGVKFTVDVPGFIKGVRFYKGEGNVGQHLGNLWSEGGQLLARATFANETAGGWQQVSFETPVAVSPGTVYVGSYFAPAGHYALSAGFFAESGLDAGPVNLLQDGVAGGNGVFAYGASSFPNGSWNASNYWVDVLFATSMADRTNPNVTSVMPSDGSFDVTINPAVIARFSEQMDAASVTATFVLQGPSAAIVPASVAYDSATFSALLTPDAALEPGTTYTAVVRGGAGGATDTAGNPLPSDFAWSFTTMPPGPCTSGTNRIVMENCLPGSPSSEWDVTSVGDRSIQGFATEISVNVGETVRFKVDTDASSYQVDIYRLGYYQGNGARKVATVQPSAPLPQLQPACLSDPTTGLIDCGNWSESASWTVPANAVSGIYIGRLERDDDGGASHMVFVVRDDSSTSDLVFQTSDTTWQAYNDYGGNSLYVGSPAGRAYKVSYNRPFATRSWFGGEDWLFNAEYPMVRWLEANGYDVTYITGVDTHRSGNLLLNHDVFLSVGHDEYWSGLQRTNVEAARDAGVHLAFFSGNEIFWKTRWEPSIDGSSQPYRTLVSYKETHADANIDPQSPPTWTGTWRDPRFSPPADGGRPENALTGTWFRVNKGTAAIQVPAADGRLRLWRNTSIADLQAGEVATLSDGTLGYEWDEVPDNGFQPPGLIRMSTTFVPDVMVLFDWGTNYGTGSATHHLTLYKHQASGALVFGAGTIQWSWGLDGNHDKGGSVPDARMQQATVNLLADMGVQPASLQSGLVPATASSDFTPPSSEIISPSNGATVSGGSSVDISGTATDSGGGVVGGVEVSVDGGASWHPAQGRTSWSYSWTPEASGQATILVRAADDSANLEVAGPSITVDVE